MKFYLSSYKLGTRIDDFTKLLTKNRTMAYIPNASDGYGDIVERIKEKESMRELEQQLQDYGVEVKVEMVDLRTYFGRTDELQIKLEQFGIIFVKGGNVYILREAFRQSGLDQLLHHWYETDFDIVYAGYSAGVCVLAPSLEGIHLMDDLTLNIYGKLKYDIDGVGLLDCLVIPHYKSPGHSETEMAEDCLMYMKEHNLPYKLLRDGEVIIIT